MLQSLKQFRKRHFSNDPVIASFPLGACVKASAVHEAAVKQSVKKDDHDDVKDDEDDDQISFSKAVDIVPSVEEAAAMKEHPKEPVELDHPIRCPHPEPCILQDGRALKERVPSTKRRGQLPFLTDSELKKLDWKRRSAYSDNSILPAAIAPEPSLFRALP